MLFKIFTIFLGVAILPTIVLGIGGWHHPWLVRKHKVQTTSATTSGSSELNKNTNTASPNIIETTSGAVEGIESVSRNGKPFLQFLGIPYGKAPTGQLRFESPQPVEKREGIFNASQYGPHCAQFNIFNKKIYGQEDCLSINVLVPKERSPDKLLPVYAYIHGGAFFIGASSEQKGDYFMDHDVVYVSFNYRLGALGFLKTNDGLVRGNMGLKDQNLALQWIQKNIAKFGGDPDLVTIAGNSAGSISVSAHLLSPKSKGLFSKAALMSGTILSPWAIITDTERNAQLYISKVKCDKATDGTVACLKKLDLNVLLNGHDDVVFPAPLNLETYFIPTVESVKDEDAFLTQTPVAILKSGEFNKVPILGGVTEEELLIVTAALSGNKKESDEAKNNFNAWAPRLLHYKADDDISTKINDFYYKGKTDAIGSGTGAKATSALFSDRIFTYGLYKFTKYFSPHVPVFLYYHTWKPDVAIANIFSTSNQTWVGSSHGDDVALFANSDYAIPIGPQHRLYNMSIDAVDLWVQFLNEEWMSFKSVPWWQNNPKKPTLTYLHIDESPEIEDDPFADRMKFWESLEGKIKNSN